MPRLPDLNSLGQRPTPFNRQGISVADTSSSSRAIEGLGNTVSQVADQYAKEQDAQAVFEAKRKLDEWEQAKVYDPQNGAIAKRGKDAFDLPNQLPSELDKFAGEISGGLTSNRQKQAFQEMLLSRKGQLTNWASRHALREREVYDEGQYQADVTGSMNRVATLAGAGEIDTAKAEIATMQARTVGFLRAKGRSEEEIGSAVKQNTSKAHVSVLNRYLEANDPGKAEEYLKANAGSMMEDDYLRAKTVVDKQAAIKIGEDGAAAAWAEIGPKGYNDPVPVDKLEARVREMFAGDDAKRKVAIIALKERVAGHNQAQAEFNAAAVNGVYKQIDGGTPMSQVMRTPEWQSLPGKEQDQILYQQESRAAARESRAAAAASRAVSAASLNDRRLLLTNGQDYLADTSPDRLAKMSRPQVEAMRSKYGMDATQHLLKSWDSLQKPEKVIEAKIDKEDFEQIADQMGLKPFSSNKSEAHQRALGDLKYRVERLIDMAQANKKAPLTREEKGELMRTELARQVTVPGGWFSSDKKVPVVQLTPDQAAKVAIPDNDRAQIVEALKTMYGKNPNNPAFAPTDANVRRLYLQSQSRAATLIPEAK